MSADFRRFMKDVVKQVEKAGWTVTVNGHYKFKGPNGEVVCCSFSPKNGSQVAYSIRRDFKKVGVELEV